MIGTRVGSEERGGPTEGEDRRPPRIRLIPRGDRRAPGPKGTSPVWWVCPTGGDNPLFSPWLLLAAEPGFDPRLGPEDPAVRFAHPLRDPDGRVPFALVHHFTGDRPVTPADITLCAGCETAEGDLEVSDRWGFTLRLSSDGRILETRRPRPPGGGSPGAGPEDPYAESGSALRVMRAVGDHAHLHGALHRPVFSPWHVLLDDGNPAVVSETRSHPPEGSGLRPASSKIFRIDEIRTGGFPVLPWTVNDPTRAAELLGLGVDGLITDRPDLLRTVLENHGDRMLFDGGLLLNPSRFDLQGHRGARGLRPENTLPSMEAALDCLVTTLETDTGVSADGVALLSHDPLLNPAKCRRADGSPVPEHPALLLRDFESSALQQDFVCDRTLTAFAGQENHRSLSPVACAFADAANLADPYTMPTLGQLFDFTTFYAEYYRRGPGRDHPSAVQRWKNAARVRFNVETKINPRRAFAGRTVGPEAFARAVSEVIASRAAEERTDVQSFDFRTLLWVHEHFPRIRTVCLFADFPVFADPRAFGSEDGANLQDEDGANTPWLAGLPWPYRQG